MCYNLEYISLYFLGFDASFSSSCDVGNAIYRHLENKEKYKISRANAPKNLQCPKEIGIMGVIEIS